MIRSQDLCNQDGPTLLPVPINHRGKWQRHGGQLAIIAHCTPFQKCRLFLHTRTLNPSLPPSFRSMHTNELSSLLPFSTIHRILFISSLYAYTIERARFELLIADVRVLRKGSGFGSVDRVHGFVFNRQLSAASGHAATRPTRKKWLDWRDWRAKWSL